MTYEEEVEREPLTPELEAALLDLALERAVAEMRKMTCIQSEDEAFVRLPHAAAAAFHLGQLAEAKLYAERALDLAPAYRNTWNYGNAVHLGHTVLGLLAHSERDLPRAIAELHASARIQGSPRLNSFGPTMQLAKALLRDGQVLPVLEYLALCRMFWKMGGAWLDVWERKIHAGQQPNFFHRSYA